MTIFSFTLCLAIFTIIGIASSWKSLGTKRDYYLASSNVSPWLVGLSSVATNNSGYMFIGVIGYTYATGLASIWLMVGWITGDFLASLYIHARLRKATERTGEVSYAGVLSNWFGQGNSTLQRVIAVISLLFLLSYASAQLIAGSKALHVLFDWPLWAGAVLGSVLVTVYCIAGGIRASIWTDAAQAFVMIIAMGILLFVATDSLGGVAPAIHQMNSIDGFMNWFPKNSAIPGLAGGLLFITSWLFAGMSVVGQPHIMVRFMTMRSVDDMRQARIWYYLWFLGFYSMATGVGMLARIHLPDAASFDAELALPTMAMQLLSPALVGLILAGIFAATMSTADSLILSCSAALTHDLIPHTIEKTWLLKLSTIAITLTSLVMALSSNQSVFNMVIMSWSGLASAFSPLLLVLCLGGRPSQLASILAVVTGLAVAMGWRWLGWQAFMYEGLPGIAAGLSVLLFARMAKQPETALADTY